MVVITSPLAELIRFCLPKLTRHPDLNSERDQAGRGDLEAARCQGPGRDRVRSAARWGDPRVGDRQHACGKPEYQSRRRRNPCYDIAYRFAQRSAQAQPPPEVLPGTGSFRSTPWEFAKDRFWPQCADFIAVLAALLFRFAKDQVLARVTLRRHGHLPSAAAHSRSGDGSTDSIFAS